MLRTIMSILPIFTFMLILQFGFINCSKNPLQNYDPSLKNIELKK